MNSRKVHHYISLLVTCAVVAVCGLLMPKVNINSDMTKYLPDNSPMRKGIEILDKEFPASQMKGADVRVMFTDLEDSLKQVVKADLEALPQVSSVTSRSDQSGEHTLYELGVSKSVDQKRFGQEISKSYGDTVIVETSQDGATPPVSVLVIAGSLILLILIVMTDAWIAPVLFMLATGLAVIINIGTNYFLPSVSITTNYIVAILQLVLSLDYSIILMNRYRQERALGLDPQAAMNVALPKAAPSIISSATTTIVGLLMLVFMKLKIGMDMGVVLAKGVVCSLICNFTALPGLILLMDKWIQTTTKKTFVIPTDPLARFGTRHRVTLVVVFLVIFFGSYFLHNKTVISFSTNSASAINEYFPKKNLVVLAYSNEDENRIVTLADSLSALEGVEGIISYPTMLGKEYTAEQLVESLKNASTEMGKQSGMEVPAEAEKFLTPDMIRLVYHMKYGDSANLKLGFPELAEFITGTCLTSPLTKDFIDDSMREKIGMLDAFGGPSIPEEALSGASEQQSSGAASGASSQDQASGSGASSGSSAGGASSSGAKTSGQGAKTSDGGGSGGKVVVPVVTKNVAGGYSIIEFMKKLAAKNPSDNNIKMLAHLVEVDRLRTPMDVSQMSAFIGSTMGQTKMVYSFSKSKSKTMTPLEYVHFLSDDLFNRKALASMVSASQKAGLNARKKIMDYANSDARLAASEISSLVTTLGVSGMDESQVKALMGEGAKTSAAQSSTKPDEQKGSASQAATAPNTSANAEDSVQQTIPDSSAISNATDSAAIGNAPDSAVVGNVPDSVVVVAVGDTLAMKDSLAAVKDSTVMKTQTPDAGKPSSAPAASTTPAAPRKSLEDIRQDLFMDMMSGQRKYSAKQMAANFKRLGEDIGEDLVTMIYLYYDSVNNYDDSRTMTIEGLVNFLTENVFNDPKFSSFVDEASRNSFADVTVKMNEGKEMLRSDKHSIAVLISNHPDESAQTYEYIDKVQHTCDEQLQGEHYLIGESVMFDEMKNGFRREMLVITLLTVLAIFVIVALTFRSFIVPLILVMTVMSGVFVNVWFSGFGGNTMLYLAYLIVQSILMGATIDYGILFTSYYREKRKSMEIPEAVREAYKGSIRTILTSGLIMCVAPGVMSLLVADNVAISAIVGCLSVGAFVSVMLILFVVPGLLAAFDRLVIPRKKAFKKE